MTVHERTLLVAVARLAITQARAAGTAAKAAGVNPTSYAILAELSLDGWLTNGEIAERLGLSTGGVAPALDRLERAGLVERSPNPADRRSSVIRMTDPGQELLHTATAALQEELDGFVAGLDAHEADVVLRFLVAANDAYLKVQERLDP